MERIQAQTEAIARATKSYDEIKEVNEELFTENQELEKKYAILESIFKCQNDVKREVAEKSIWGKLIFLIVQSKRKSDERNMLKYFKTAVEADDRYCKEQKDYLIKCISDGIRKKVFYELCDPSLEAMYMSKYRLIYEKVGKE